MTTSPSPPTTLSPARPGTDPGSFRDPAGFVFRRDGELYRQVNASYRPAYDLLMGSGLYEHLTERGLLVRHQETDLSLAPDSRAYKIIKPRRVEFIGYPFEWCFSQLQDSALATLDIQAAALARGMSLKDANAGNIQLVDGRPALIDTLSFEPYEEGFPWVAYRQFCQHFLAPLALMSRTDIRLGQLLLANLDGVPLDLAVRLLPVRSRLNPGLFMHLHLHARGQRRHLHHVTDRESLRGRMNLRKLLALIGSLRSTVRKLRWNPGGSDWADYYQQDSYTGTAFEQKKKLVAAMLAGLDPGPVWDLGANTGEFSRIALARGDSVVSLDFDPGAVEINYRQMTRDGESGLFPLVADLTNPTPATGWVMAERRSLLDRGPAHTVIALALTHHLAISNNVPFAGIAAFFAGLTRHLIVEFVPAGDPMAARLLSMRNHDFPDYTVEAFEAALGAAFTIRRREPIPNSRRVLYLMENAQSA
jgi:hypothetical protein